MGAKCRLGRERTRERDKIVIRPGELHVNSLLAVLGMVGCKPLAAPALEGTVELEDIEPLKQEDITKYKRALGIAVLRDGQSGHHVCRQGGGPLAARTLQAHLRATKRLARYMAGTSDYAVGIRRPAGQDILVTTDANWAGCKRSRKCSS